MGIKEYYELLENENPDDDLNGMKAEVAWILGLDEYSEEFGELVEI